jgi:hypothetical protein
VGELPAACDLGGQVVDGRRRVLGVDHPDTLDSAHNLGMDLAEAGRAGAARALLADTLARRRQVLGERHPETQRTARVLVGLPADADGAPAEPARPNTGRRGLLRWRRSAR